MFRLAFFICLIVATFITTGAQQQLSPVVISSGGGFTSEGAYSLSYTLGETAIKTLSSNSFMLTEGFQQSHFRTINPNLPADTRVFPNPVVDILYVNIKANESSKFILTIYSITGKAIVGIEYSGYTAGYFDAINVAHFSKGLYLVKIEAMDGSLQRTFKIEKL